jgi:hypothetical protein
MKEGLPYDFTFHFVIRSRHLGFYQLLERTYKTKQVAAIFINAALFISLTFILNLVLEEGCTCANFTWAALYSICSRRSMPAPQFSQGF